MDETFKVEVGVGAQRRTFAVYKNIAVRNGSYFKIALNRDWQGAPEKLVSLPDCEPDIFENYLHFIYSGNFPFRRELESRPYELIKLWLLGDLLRDNNFCTMAVESLKSQPTIIKPDAIAHLYDNTLQDSQLRLEIFRMWADRYSVVAFSDIFVRQRAYPKDFIIELFEYLARFGRIFNAGIPQPQFPGEPDMPADTPEDH